MSEAIFLLSNDDGVHAPGIRALAEAVKPLGKVVVVAPHVERSASSHAITIHSPLRVEEFAPDIYAVEGSPADCVMLACRRLLHRKPTWVLSGINRGANLGVDTIYSGTVGAAMEATIMGFPSMAISCLGKTKDKLHYETAGKIVAQLLQHHDQLLEVAKAGVININVPNLPFNQIKGVRTATLGRRLYDEEMVQGMDPRGRPYYWIGSGGDMFEDMPGSDCELTDKGFVAMSVLKPSFLDLQTNGILEKRLGSVFGKVNFGGLS